MGDSEHIDVGPDFNKVISLFISRMGFVVDSSESLADGSLEFLAKTTNPMGGNVTSLIRATPALRSIGKEDVQSLYSSMVRHNAVRAAYITTSEFSDEAREAASELPISLISKYQIMESLENRGFGWDKELISSLEKYGLSEKYFQGVEQSFSPSKSYEGAKKYFESKGNKKNLFGQVVGSDVPVKIRMRYAPVAVLKFITLKDVWTGTQELRKVEKRDHIFINLNNLDLYYIMQKRKKNVTETTLNTSDILKKINGLPEDSKTYLMYLLQHGDLLADDFESVDLTILKNKKVIQTYEGDKEKPAKDFTEMAEKLLESTLESVLLLVDEIISGISTMGETTVKKDSEKPKKKVEAYVVTPDIYGGVYDIWAYMETQKGINLESEVDPVVYGSGSQIPLLSAILKAKVTSEGILFLPYYRAKYVNPKSQKTTKYEMLYVPKFKGEHTQQQAAEEKQVQGTIPKISSRRIISKQPYRIIK